MLHWNWAELRKDTSHKWSNTSVSSTRCQFSIIIEPLFESYNGMVSTASMEELCRSTLSWLDQHCSLPTLRPSESSPTCSSTETLSQLFIFFEWLVICVCLTLSVVLRSLRFLSTTTAILTDPSLLPEQATLAVTQSDHSALLEHSLQPPAQDHVHTMWLCRASGDWKFTTMHVREDRHL